MIKKILKVNDYQTVSCIFYHLLKSTAANQLIYDPEITAGRANI